MKFNLNLKNLKKFSPWPRMLKLPQSEGLEKDSQTTY